MTQSRTPVAALRALLCVAQETRACLARASGRRARLLTRAIGRRVHLWCTRLSVLVHNLDVHSCAMHLGALLHVEDVGVRRQIAVRSCAMEMRASVPKDEGV